MAGAGRGLVLVVEDEAAIAEVIELYLRRDGFDVRIVSDGEAALVAWQELRPVAVILDIGLPGRDGADVCRTMRAAGDWTPVLFVTARDDEIDRLLGLEIGADDYVTKPFSPRELAARVRTVLRRTTAVPPTGPWPTGAWAAAGAAGGDRATDPGAGSGGPAGGAPAGGELAAAGPATGRPATGAPAYGALAGGGAAGEVSADGGPAGAGGGAGAGGVPAAGGQAAVVPGAGGRDGGGTGGGGIAGVPVGEVLSVGAVRVDVGRRRVWAGEVEVSLTSTEFDLLAQLFRRPGRVFERDELLSSVWGYQSAAGTRTVDVHIAQLRAKLGEASPIRTVRGVGYAADCDR